MSLKIPELCTEKTIDFNNELSVTVEHLNDELTIAAERLNDRLTPTAEHLNHELTLTAENLNGELAMTTEHLNHELTLTAENLNAKLPMTATKLNNDLLATAAYLNEEVSIPTMSKGRIVKNLIALNLGFLLICTSQMGLTFLQSTLNSKNNIGVISQSVSYLVFIGTSLYLPRLLSIKFGLKKAIAMAISAFVPYFAANLHVKMWTFIPCAIIAGFGLSVLWVSSSTYINDLSFLYAERDKEKAKITTRIFFGIFNLSFGLSQFLGNLVSFLVFTVKAKTHFAVESFSAINNQSTSIQSTMEGLPIVANKVHKHYFALKENFLGNKTETIYPTVDDIFFPSNSTVDGFSVLKPQNVSCGANFCGGIEQKMQLPSLETKFFLIGIYLFLGIFAILITCIFLDTLEINKKQSEHGESMHSRIISAFKQTIKIDQILLILSTIYCSFQMGFMFCDFPEAYVACAWGIENVGLVIMCFAVITLVMCGIQACLSHCISRQIFITFATLNNIGLCIVMLSWNPSDTHFSITLIIAGLWAISDAIWGTQISALYGVLFREQEEAAFANLRLWEGVGLLLSFACNSLLCTSTKLYMHIAIVSAGFFGYLAVEIKCHLSEENAEITMKQPSCNEGGP